MIEVIVLSVIFSGFAGWGIGISMGPDFWTHRTKVRELEHAEKMAELAHRTKLLELR